jgi:hypothetical protein
MECTQHKRQPAVRYFADNDNPAGYFMVHQALASRSTSAGLELTALRAAK